MGVAGTEVAKGAADMILTDDNFSTIVDAVSKGRDVFSNIRKTVYFLLVCNFSEIVIMLGAMLFGWAMPLTPIMLLLINVLGDGIPGISLAKEKSDPRIMQRNPIGRGESLFNGLQLVITKQIIAFVAVAWIGYYIGSHVYFTPGCVPSHVAGQTMAFLIVGWTSILHIFTVRSRKSVFKSSFKDNPRIVISAVSMIALFAIIVAIPPFAATLGMLPIGLGQWLTAAALSVVPTISAEIGKYIQNRAEENQYRRRLVRHASGE
jgi:magnesium-transporting ATPase (P-type)